MGKLGGRILRRLEQSVRGNRRDTVYKMTAKKNKGQVPCAVCGRHVAPNRATLEHLVPLSKGGTDDMDNLGISHWYCNNQRGNKDLPNE